MKVDKRLNENEIRMLAELKGRTIENIQGAFRFDDADVWKTLRVNAENLCIDVNLFQEELPSSDEEGSYDETGVFTVVKSEPAPLVVETVPLEVKTKLVGKQIKNIRVYESEIKYFENSLQYFQMNITKAIAFEFEDVWLVLDRKVWFDEAITVTFCSVPEEGIRRDEEDWQNGDDEVLDGEFTMEYQIICHNI